MTTHPHGDTELTGFLTGCAAHAHRWPRATPPRLTEHSATVFVTAGLAALQADAGNRWVQVNLPVPRSASLYADLATHARTLLRTGAAVNFFFMHKSPGLRLRFEAAEAAEVPALRDEVLRWARDLGAAEASEDVYEPEAYLFGGPAAMEAVHRLFTADALAWADFHAAGADSAPADGAAAAERVPAWAVSLVLLHALVEGLGIAGWEHRGVWQAVVEEAGRRLPRARPGGSGTQPEDGSTGDGSDQALRSAADGIRACWEAPGGPAELLPEGARQAWLTHRTAVGAAAERWRADYFDRPGARIGRRRAAAYAAVFHWNRAAMPLPRQSLLAEALLGCGAGVER